MEKFFDWLPVVIPIVIVIATMIGKANQARSAAGPSVKHPRSRGRAFHRPADLEDSFYEEAAAEKHAPAARASARFSASEAKTESSEAPFVPKSEQSSKTPDATDYAEFLQQHGREAVVLAEILLPPNSRASAKK